MDSEQLLAEIREANLTYLMLAQGRASATPSPFPTGLRSWQPKKASSTSRVTSIAPFP